MVVMLDLERKVINRLQLDFPICNSPFEKVAKELEISEQQLLACLKKLTKEGVLTRFGPLFDVKKMGGNFSLCAMQVCDEKFKAVTDILNSMPEVAHNYQREHELNMWFVLATETQEDIKTSISKIEKISACRVYDFPKQKEFFVKLYLKV
jgi:DNA-binding Lrp family transcriptional regulator